MFKYGTQTITAPGLWKDLHGSNDNGHIGRLSLSIILCVCVVLLLTACTTVLDDPESVATELVEAFVAADAERAKSVAVPEQWNRIEEWVEGRQPFECRGGQWGDPTGTGGSGHCDVSSGEWSWGLVYQCPSRRTPYCLLVNDIRVKQTEDGWRVYDWGAMCEASDYAYRCSDLCGD